MPIASRIWFEINVSYNSIVQRVIRYQTNADTLPVKFSAGPNPPFGKIGFSKLLSVFAICGLQLVVSNANEAIAVINNILILFSFFCYFHNYIFLSFLF
jgi:hypothetical protein